MCSQKLTFHLAGSGAAAFDLPPLVAAAGDNADTQCVTASDMDDLAGKFRASASAIDEAALVDIGMVHALHRTQVSMCFVFG